MIRDKLGNIKERLDQIDEKRRDRWQRRAGVDDDDLQAVIINAAGDSVNRESLIFPIGSTDSVVSFNLLDDGEQPHYFLKGSTIDVEGQGAGSESIIGWDRDRRIGGSYTVITENRVLIIANHARGYDEHTIPYDTITNVNLNSGLTSTRLSIQTKSATYHCSVSKSKRKFGKGEVTDAVEYLRERRNRVNEPDTTSDDPLDRIEKLKSLHEDGVLTDEEFEEKKESLLDEV